MSSKSFIEMSYFQKKDPSKGRYKWGNSKRCVNWQKSKQQITMHNQSHLKLKNDTKKDERYFHLKGAEKSRRTNEIG